jgi:MFS transporter, SHS family, sialic acid transporter
MNSTSNKQTTHSRAAWLALIAALLGWMFDGAEMGVFSLVGRQAVKDLLPAKAELLLTAEELQLTPALQDPLLKKKHEDFVGMWFNIIMAGFLVGAATGGVVFGWLGDRIGRVRAMTLSVFTYAIFTGLCGMAAEAWQVGLLRFIAALGMGGEWSLGVALVMEVWPNKSRAFMAGLIGAAANVGYVLVGFVGLGLLQVLASLESIMLSIGISDATAKMLVANQGWRLLMMLGTAPALLTFFIRRFVPESEKWEEQQTKEVTSSWATRDLLAVLVGLLGPFLIVYVWSWSGPVWFPNSTSVCIVGTLLGLVIATLGYLYPVVRYLQRQTLAGKEKNQTLIIQRMLLAAGLSGIALLGTWGSTQQAPSWGDKLAEDAYKTQHTLLIEAGDTIAATALKKAPAKEYMLITSAFGAVVGTLVAAMAGDYLGRRISYFLLCVLSITSAWTMYLTHTEYGTSMLVWSFIVGACTASFYGWLPLYLPELFPTNVRATGQGFGFNFGRILAAVGVLQTGNLLAYFSQDIALTPTWSIPGRHPAACSVVVLVYLFGMILIWFAPETKGQPLPD